MKTVICPLCGREMAYSSSADMWECHDCGVLATKAGTLADRREFPELYQKAPAWLAVALVMGIAVMYLFLCSCLGLFFQALNAPNYQASLNFR